MFSRDGEGREENVLPYKYFMFPRQKRIRKAPDITFVLKRGKKLKTSLVTISVYNKGRGLFRGLVICSRKVDKRATRRNSVKRRVREILRKEVESRLPFADMVVEIQKGAAEATYQTLKTEILNVLHLS